jgi:hypothetical protein
MMVTHLKRKINIRLEIDWCCAAKWPVIFHVEYLGGFFVKIGRAHV